MRHLNDQPFHPKGNDGSLQTEGSLHADSARERMLLRDIRLRERRRAFMTTISYSSTKKPTLQVVPN